MAFINTYLEGREALIASDEYPAHHLWGVDHLPKDRFAVSIVPPSGSGLVNRFGRWLSRLTRFRFGDLDQEWEIWKRRRQMDIAYVADGNVFWLLLLRTLGLFKPRIVRWTYTPRMVFPWWTLRNLNFPWMSRGIDVLLCLTNRAAEAYSKEMPWLRVVQMDWGADENQFQPGSRDGGFFFACGKTNRDYVPVLKAAPSIAATIVLIVHRAHLEGCELAPNVQTDQGSPDGLTDKGISYPDLIARYYHRALAILIPLRTVKDDTAGMTNLLEAMACGLPVIMTRGGAIDLDLEKEGIGFYVDPGDAEGWKAACQWLQDHPSEARAMGARSRRLVETHYNSRRVGRDLSRLFHDLQGVPHDSLA